MTQAMLLVLFALSSIVAGSLAAGRRCPQAASRAVARALEFVGLWTLCLGLNIGLGMLIILALRVFSSLFISIYVVNDLSVVFVSALQASVLHAWLSTTSA